MLARFFAYYAPWKGLFLLDFGCAVLSGLLELGFPLAVKTFIDNLLPAAATGGSSSPPPPASSSSIWSTRR